MNVTVSLANAAGVASRDLHARPVDVEALARTLAGSTIVGIGESTRLAKEIFELRERVSRRLVEVFGFRVLAIQDSANAAACLNQYVHGGDGSAVDALETAWQPWKTTQMVAVLDWIREFNSAHPKDPVRIVGVKPVQAVPADYDDVLAAVRELAPAAAPELTEHFDVLKSAHIAGEHVQRTIGIYSARPFLEHARVAAALVAAVPELPAAQRDRMALILEYHERSVAGRASYGGEAAIWAETIIAEQRRAGARVLYWDGVAHVSAAVFTTELGPDRSPQLSVGSVLREHYGREYASVAIGFSHGRLGKIEIPPPAADLVDAALATVDLPVHMVDVRADVAFDHTLGAVKLRLISPFYDVSRDAADHIAVASLAAAYDVLVHVREVSSVGLLPRREPPRS
jgi:erythromycin esterase